MQSPEFGIQNDKIDVSRSAPLHSSLCCLNHAFHSKVLLVMVLAACVVLPRSLSMIAAHSESNDDVYHLQRGLLTLCGIKDWAISANDPALGEAIIALPMWVTRCLPTNPLNPDTMADHGAALRAGGVPLVQPHRVNELYGQWLMPETILFLVAIWNSLLFLPFVGLCFHWCRELYGSAAGWLAAALVCVEPTFAAHIPVAALDVLGVEFIAFACWLAWRYACTPTRGRVIGLAIAVAAAMLVKHTAVILPLVVVLYVLAFRKRTIPHEETEPQPTGPASTSGTDWSDHLAIGMLVWAIAMWALCRFDISMPYDSGGRLLRLFGRYDGTLIDFVNDQLVRQWPAGIYIGSVISALNHATRGHWALLFGEHRAYGWWYYFFAVALFKVPLSIFALMAISIVSLGWRRPTWAEMSLAIPCAAWATFVSRSGVNIGFRHFLPAYTFMLLLCVRVVGTGRTWSSLAWVCCVVAALNAFAWHPDYIAFLNWPYRKAYLDISDSNIEWGQPIRQIREWLLLQRPRKPVWIRFGWSAAEAYLLGDLNLGHLSFTSPRPTSGLLIIRPGWVAGMYDPTDGYGALRDEDPDAVIGHCVLVFDLDRLFAKGFHWKPLVTTERRTDWHPGPGKSGG